MSDPKPEHDWAGDELGHNCAHCANNSIWKCDRPVHDRWTERVWSDIQALADSGDKVAARLLANRGSAA